MLGAIIPMHRCLKNKQLKLLSFQRYGSKYIMHSCGGVVNTCMKLEKHYICWIERRWHIPNKSPFAIIDDGSGGSDVGM